MPDDPIFPDSFDDDGSIPFEPIEVDGAFEDDLSYEVGPAADDDDYEDLADEAVVEDDGSDEDEPVVGDAVDREESWAADYDQIDREGVDVPVEAPEWTDEFPDDTALPPTADGLPWSAAETLGDVPIPEASAGVGTVPVSPADPALGPAPDAEEAVRRWAESQ